MVQWFWKSYMDKGNLDRWTGRHTKRQGDSYNVYQPHLTAG